MVAMPPFRKRGRMTKASTSSAKPEVASQAMELMEPENA